MATMTCGYQGCKNPIKSDDTRCWRHKDSDTEAHLFDASDVERIRSTLNSFDGDTDTLIHPAPGMLSDHVARAHLVMKYNESLDESDAMAITRAIERVSGQFNLEIPDDVLEHSQRLTDAFMEALEENGVSPSRISRMRCIGLNRRLPSGKVRSQGDFYHEVLLLDNRTVMEPTLSGFAPIKNRDQPIENPYLLSRTPYGDVPHVIPLEEYQRDEWIWWDHTEIAT